MCDLKVTYRCPHCCKELERHPVLIPLDELRCGDYFMYQNGLWGSEDSELDDTQNIYMILPHTMDQPGELRKVCCIHSDEQAFIGNSQMRSVEDKVRPVKPVNIEFEELGDTSSPNRKNT